MATGCSWPAGGPGPDRCPSVAWASRVFQLTADPSQRLLGQSFHILIASVLEQLCQRRSQQFSATPVGIGLESVPITITDSEALMKNQRLFKALFRPFLRGHVAVGVGDGRAYPHLCEGWSR